MNCLKCKRNYNCMIFPECPYCNNIIKDNNLESESSSEKSLQTILPSNTIANLLSKDNTIQSRFDFQITCPKCYRIVPRNAKFCPYCISLLHNSTSQQIEENFASNAVQMLSADIINQYLQISGKAFLLYYTQNGFNYNCPYCQKEISWVEDYCPYCKNIEPISFYQCRGSYNGHQCSYKMKMLEEECPICHTKGLFYMLKETLEGRIRGDIANSFLSILSKIFVIDASTLSSAAHIDHGEIIYIKNNAEEICGQTSAILESIAKVLNAVTNYSQNEEVNELPDSISAMKKPENNWFSSNIVTPTKSKNVLNIIEQRVLQSQNKNAIMDNDPMNEIGLDNSTEASSKPSVPSNPIPVVPSDPQKPNKKSNKKPTPIISMNPVPHNSTPKKEKYVPSYDDDDDDVKFE